MNIDSAFCSFVGRWNDEWCGRGRKKIPLDLGMLIVEFRDPFRSGWSHCPGSDDLTT